MNPTTKEYAKSLRQLAAFYETAPEDLPMPYDFQITAFVHTDKPAQAAEAIRLTHILGEADKKYSGESLILSREFGIIELRFFFDRDAVCTRVVVGKKIIPAQSWPEREVDVVEWECHPLLAATKK